MQMIVGRSFVREYDDETRAVIVNEELVRFMEWGTPEKALGKQLRTPSGREVVVGVVENFHFQSLHEEVMPFVLDLANSERQQYAFLKYIAIRITNGADELSALKHIEQVWNARVPNRSFEYVFLGKQLNRLYLQELKLGYISAHFSLVAILIACLGLFGLSSFVVEQKQKEIAIRKALGANNLTVVVLLSSEFLSLVGISVLIAWPFSYFMIDQWLNRFPFKIAVHVAPFLYSALIILAVTLFTVSYHTIRAAVKNPVNDLNRE